MSHIKKFKFLKGYSNNINSHVNIVSPRTSIVMSSWYGFREPLVDFTNGVLSQITPIELTTPNPRIMMTRNPPPLSDSRIIIHNP